MKSNFWQHFQHQATTVALPQLYYIISIDRTEEYQKFYQKKLFFCKPKEKIYPPKEQLFQSAEVLIVSAAKKAGFRGSLGGLGGPVTSLPDNLLFLIQILRLTQRMAMLYGKDHRTELGKSNLLKAIAHAYGIKLPKQQGVRLQFRDFTQHLGSMDTHQSIVYFLLEQLKKRRLQQLKKWIPGIGLGFGAYDSYRAVIEMGGKIRNYYSRQYTEEIDDSKIIEAIIVKLR